MVSLRALNGVLQFQALIKKDITEKKVQMRLLGFLQMKGIIFLVLQQLPLLIKELTEYFSILNLSLINLKIIKVKEIIFKLLFSGKAVI